MKIRAFSSTALQRPLGPCSLCRLRKRRSDRFAIISQSTFATFGGLFPRRADQAAAGMRYSSARVSKAHTTRAFLLANATAAMFGSRRLLSAATHMLRRSRLRRA
jgi:hypothetical protein